MTEPNEHVGAIAGFGCRGGVAVYLAARMLARVANPGARGEPLGDGTIALMRPLFPELDLSRVRVFCGCRLPANFLSGPGRYAAMTFGYAIYARGRELERTHSGLLLLMHELVHVDQVRRRGDDELAFACDYGRAFLEGRSYRSNALEVEAFDFVAAHAEQLSGFTSRRADAPP